MSNNNNNKKHIKWTEPWKEELIKGFGKKIEVDKHFKKGEKKPDGSTVSTDAGETIKVEVNDFEQVFKEVENQRTKVKNKLDELNNKTSLGSELANIYKAYDELEKKLYTGTDGNGADSWKNEKTNDLKRYDDFLKDAYGAGTTKGWKNIQKEYYGKTWKDKGGNDKDYSNLYEFHTRTETDFNKISYWKITEQEVVKLVTRTFKELGKIDKTRFDNFVNKSTTKLPASTTYFPKCNDGSSTTGKTNLINWMDAARNRAKFLVEKNKGHRKEYEFGQDYTKFGGNTSVDTSGTVFDHTELENLFDLCAVLRNQISEWGQDNDFKDIVKDIMDDTLVVLPAEKEPVAESKLKDWGMEGYIVDPTSKKTNYYLTDYGTKLSDYNTSPWKKSEFSWDTKQELKIEEGLKGWASLIYFIGNEQMDDWNNKYKLMSSFTDDPVSQLFQDTRDTDEFERFGTTKQYTLEEFPKAFAIAEKRFYELKSKKKSILKQSTDDQGNIAKLDQEYQDEKKSLNDLETEVDKKIKEKKDELRKKLKDQFNIDNTTYKGFKKTATEDNRIEISDINKIELLLRQIRYLENFDEDTPSSVNNEELARNELKELSDTIFIKHDNDTKIHLVKTFNTLKGDDTKKIEKFEEEYGSKASWVLYSLQDVLTGFDNLEEIIKLPEDYQKSKKAIKDYVEQKNDNEQPKDWQNDPALGADFTDEIVNKWKATKKFKLITDVRKLLQGVRETDKTDFKEDFLKWLKDKKIVDGDGTTEKGIENWKTLVKKNPKEVIAAIEFYKYDKLDDSLKAEKKKKLVWTLEKKDESGKYLEDADLTEEEIKTVLYEIAEGTKSLASQKKEDECHEDGNNGGGGNQIKNESWWKFGNGNWRPFVSYGLIILGVIGITVAVFWKNITEWWNGPTEEEKITAETEEKEDDD